MNTWLSVIYIFIGGFAGALQARILGNVEAKIGILGNMLVNFFFGFIFTLVILSSYSFLQYENPFKIWGELHIERIKTWEMTAGLFGIIIVTSIGFSASRVGVTGTLLLFFFSQIVLGLFIDHFGWLSGQNFTITPLKLLSIFIISVGMYLFFKN